MESRSSKIPHISMKSSILWGNPGLAPALAPRGRKWGVSQGCHWLTLTWILQSICSFQCKLPGPRSQLLAPASGTHGPGGQDHSRRSPRTSASPLPGPLRYRVPKCLLLQPGRAGVWLSCTLK